MRHFAALAALLLAGCATAPVSPPDAHSTAHWEARKQRLADLDRWQLTGRIAITNGYEAWQGKIRWDQQGEGYSIQLRGPLGSGQMQLTGSAREVVLRTADNQVFYSDSPEALLREHTGVSMPVRGLRYWVIGVPEPALSHDKERIDAQGRLTELSQDDWRVQVRRYTVVQDVQLPDKLFIDKSDVSVKMVVDHWALGAADTVPAEALDM
ncbi:MAG: outer membrane lipoprotein LolB [Pseudomonadota bacterium]|nr:MAG: outer membrane lipoprotein LolB [Pseudomonadota bacterium]